MNIMNVEVYSKLLNYDIILYKLVIMIKDKIKQLEKITFIAKKRYYPMIR